MTISFDCLNDSNVPVYSSGDTVSGRVSLEVTGEIRVKSLKIHARGHAKVRWTESRNAGSNTAYTQNYTEEVEYFNHKDILVGHERGEASPPPSLFWERAGEGGGRTHLCAVSVCCTFFVVVVSDGWDSLSAESGARRGSHWRDVVGAAGEGSAQRLLCRPTCPSTPPFIHSWAF